MTITAIHSRGTGSTRAIALMLIGEIKKIAPDAEIAEFVVADFKPCLGCFACFAKGEEFCPHHESVRPVISSIEKSDVVILGTPAYCMGISGAMKCFLDHLGYRWFAHRPHPSMSSKIGVAISTAAGRGARGVTKALTAQFFGWSAAKYYRLAFTVMGKNWDEIKDEKKQEIHRAAAKTARRIVKKSGKAKRGIFLRLVLRMMRGLQKKNDWFPLDKEWWREHGWIK